MRLKDKVAIVTGAAQGIGFGVAELFVREGAIVYLADVNGDAAAAAAAKLGSSAIGKKCDISKKAACVQLVADVVAEQGHLDVLVNNAGILRTGDVLEISEEDYDAVLGVNLKGAFLLSQAAGKVMVEQEKGGSIVNMSSVNALLTIPSILPYNVSKGGLNQLTRVMGVALAQRGVRVNGVGPGSIATEMLEKVMEDEAARHGVLSRTPMGRTGTPEEIAKVVLFLASDDSSYVTGQIIYADGGRLGLNYTSPVPDA
ncbi:SDR family oxidoreductase [uncultured Sneathiella sp.]|jgi:NAD(P)-dependent dehydrogenase (short-subunit alcohol dehydrogenase family)|uniref:SDR family NAD(P)-dependent oxidoreductase n=1 Tax=uncultured Sneathiella sp. TaxID=879315 RepID=UPI0030DDDBEF|tara:strand:+ start:510 stop:1280 length:771 start_codon:yes stop_codon:yes gene_type:complete